MGNEKIVWTIVGSFIVAGVFLGLGMLTNILNGILALGTPIWTVALALIIVPYFGIKIAKNLKLSLLTDVGLAIVIVGIIAFFVPSAGFLYTPFTASAGGAIGLIALIAHLAMAAVIAGIIVERVKK